MNLGKKNDGDGELSVLPLVYRSLPVSVSGRGVRLISSATVKGSGRKEGRGTNIWGFKLVLMTFHMQHPGSAANIANCFISIRIGRHARRGGGGGVGRGKWKEGLRIAIRLVVISTRHTAAIWSGRLDMIIESASRESVAAKAISDCLKPFQGESTQRSSWLWREMQSLFLHREASRWNTLKHKEHVGNTGAVQGCVPKVTWNQFERVWSRWGALRLRRLDRNMDSGFESLHFYWEFTQCILIVKCLDRLQTGSHPNLSQNV